MNCVEDIPGQQHCLWLVLLELSEQPIEEHCMFKVAAVAQKSLSRVPVGRVQDCERGRKYPGGVGKMGW